MSFERKGGGAGPQVTFEDAEVLELDDSRVQELLVEQPELMRRLFVALAVHISHRVQAATEDFVQLVKRQADPVVRDPPLWKIVGPDAL